MKSKRHLFINSKIAVYVLGYTITSFVLVFVFITWESFVHLLIHNIPATEGILSPKSGIGPVIKIGLLIIWGVISFIISYIYLDAKFMGIFNRMDQLFKDMRQNENLTLSFRKGDAFGFVADSFNSMRKTFQDKIEARKAFLSKLTHDVEKLDPNPSSEEIDTLIQSIDNELSK